MRHFSVLILLCCLGFSPFAQQIYTKDGVSLGERETLVKACADGASEETEMEFEGVTVNFETMCGCMMDELIPRVTAAEFMVAAQQDAMEQLMMRDDLFPIVLECVLGDDDAAEAADATGFRGFFMKECVNGMLEEESWMDEGLDGTPITTADAEVYCECALEKVKANGISFEALQRIEEEDSEMYNELVLPCVMEMLEGIGREESKHTEVIDSSEPASENMDGAISNSLKSKPRRAAPKITGSSAATVDIPLQFAFNQYKVKLTIGSTSRYYLLDTGASDLIISKDVERELREDGLLDDRDYIGTERYEMADGSIVTADVVRLKSVTIGEYTVENVEAAILPDGGMLCGLSFLDVFSDWSIIRKDNVLRLYR
jgi:hypothetical protein